MNFYLLLLLVLIHKSNSESLPLNQNSTDSQIGICDQIVNEFILELEWNSKSEITRSLCKKVSECYGSQKGETAEKLKRVYDFRCEKYEFYSKGMTDCYKEILDDKFYGPTSVCPQYGNNSYFGYLDFTQADLTRRSNNLKISKSCILEIGEKKCSPEAHEYLNNNFDSFVDTLINPVKNDSCESLHAELNKETCLAVRTEMQTEWNVFKASVRATGELPITNVVKGVRDCAKIEACNNDPCNTISNAKFMKICIVYNATISNFYNCLKDYGSVHPVSIDSCKNEDKECIKKGMIEKCSDDSVEDFDRYYNWFNKYNISNIYNLNIIEGDFSKYVLEDMLPNSVSIDEGLGKCVPVVDKLVTLLSRKAIDNIQKHSRIENETCSQVVECYQSIPTEESLKLQKTYQLLCEKLEFKANDLYNCLQQFFWSLGRYGKNGHSNVYDKYFTRNNNTKRNAFLSGEELFLSNIKGRCSERGNKFLNQNYRKFVDWITIRPENDNCKSVFSATENYHCPQRHMGQSSKQDFKGLGNSPLGQIIRKDCGEAEECYKGSKCKTEGQKAALSWCEKTVNELAMKPSG